MARIRNTQKEFLFGFNALSLENVPQNDIIPNIVQNGPSKISSEKIKEKGLLFFYASELWIALGKRKQEKNKKNNKKNSKKSNKKKNKKKKFY